ncbi:hypothetical protein AMAG_16940 [Allomyces macrogynus ATCC 38327]|uniref:Dynein regulatory complex protein 12 n=1 Tax=Allomyces macrogynus (strain ATCC 38327) TaxID=578462 RepID=A0A0L0TD46_ALLM3|nr:hypothetical protein AMAG_16940 [Allomyces macrogynus ATCC 38327]|eukprot:KNE72833.1 hypothetical protein AMAG_16940 [Allomyces macrogynus ATCC 38327]
MSSKAAAKKPASAKGAKGKKADDGKSKEKTIVDDLTLKLAAATTEIEGLRRELAHRDEVIQRLKEKNDQFRTAVAKLDVQLAEKHQDRMDLAADANLEYRKLETDMKHKIALLEAQLHDVRAHYEATTAQMTKAEAEARRTIETKDAIIEEQSTRISCMATEFESMLNETMDKVSRKIQAAADQWQGDLALSPDNQRRLQEFTASTG